MKKLFLYIMFAAVGLGLQSCLHDNDEIFEQSAAERINTAIESAEKVLTSAEKGWVMHYYLGHDYTYGGINITMSFKNGKVTMREAGVVDAAGEYVALTSTYKLTRDQGPVLAFDTYNDMLHNWGDPDKDKNGAPTEVDGWEADYEFVIMSISEDENTIKLKGKKYGNTIIMERLKIDASEYLNAADAVEEGMSQFAVMKYVDGSFTAKFMYGDNYTISYINENGEKETLTVPYTFTDEGVLFNQPITLGDNIISGILYVDGAESLPLIDTKGLSITVSTDPVDVFQAGSWYLAASNLGEVGKPALLGFTDACMKEEGEAVNYCFIGTYNYRGTSAFGYWFNSGGYVGACEFSVETEGEDLITFGNAGFVGNGSYYNTKCNFSSAIAPFFSTFKLTNDDAKNPTYFILTDVNNDKNVMKLVKDQVLIPADN